MSPSNTLTHSIENDIQAVVEAGNPVPEPVQIKAVLDVAAIHLAKHFVTLQRAKPLDPSVLPIVRA